VREIFIEDLAKNLLGPRNGSNEVLDDKHRPVIEYVTGILSSLHDAQEETVANNKALGQIQYGHSLPSDEFEASDDSDIATGLNPSLNPDKIPSAMGISFQVRSDESPSLDVCLTWARYIPDSSTSPNWKRSPKYAIEKIHGLGEKKYYFDDDGKKCGESDGQVLLTCKVRNLGNRVFFVSLFMTNVTKIQDPKQKPKYMIFQPQIRIVCSGNTKLIPMGSSSDVDSIDEFVYRKREFYARGHMTSAVWWDVDPENIPEEERKQFDYAIKSPPFVWVDHDILPKESAEMFSRPHVRTEFIPIYSIPSPNIEWHETKESKPVLDAGEFSEMWDIAKIKKAIEPMHLQYRQWIDNLEKEKNGVNNALVDDIKNQCYVALERIGDGIKKLEDDEDARLAFCFANKAVDMQSRWARNGEGMRYRPFQLAFILMSLESILNPDSKYRDTCDLLWVPTGAGKTEAYLVLVAMAMAYRRLSEIKHGRSGAGVAVITRYTLRLLTIQQFRRSLSVFTAAEFLRIENLNTMKKIGWRPSGCARTGNFIWGTTPFSLGLWVGRGVTPNKLDETTFMRNGRFNKIPGALQLLKKDPRIKGDGEPAQILDCPACRNILAIPEMGLRSGRQHEINWIVNTDATMSDLQSIGLAQISANFDGVSLDLTEMNNGFKILNVKFTNRLAVNPRNIHELWNAISDKVRQTGRSMMLESVSASRPGYFYKTYVTENGSPKPYDFQIFCTKKDCPLASDWAGGSPMGGVDGSTPDPNLATDVLKGLKIEDGNKLLEIPQCFRKSTHISIRIPITGLTVDEQVYKTAPTMVIATVDKFARLPFEPLAGILFGNTEYYHMIHGYYRLDEKHPPPKGRSTPLFRQISMNEVLLPPVFIIQDELHLLEGPLGSMTGIYEACVDFLSKTGHSNVKYIASTATIKRGADQVKALFARDLQIFPPIGTDVDDRFFIKEKKRHPLSDVEPGRLYVGIMAPGKGALTPIVRIWSRLAQSGYENRGNPDIDRFWTVTGYFNAVRELAGARALYRQDIPDWIRNIAGDQARDLPELNVFELSGRTPSNDLPSILDILGRSYPSAADGLFTTSMFGTGVDISRIGIMIVNGQPKTTYSYIQSTGRVGRSKGGLVPVFHRASRPRDLSHYEYFMRNHLQLHRTVESPTVYPFSSGAVERSLGPIIVAILRNMREPRTAWSRKASAVLMTNLYNNPEIADAVNYLEERSRKQPQTRTPVQGTIQNKGRGRIDKWRNVAANVNELDYVEYDKADKSVVLGDERHEMKDDVETVFDNVPTSLRELEGETGFQT